MSYDVAIVGGKVAGAATARLLAEAGLRVLMLERSAYGSDALSTHALLGPAMAVLRQWGIDGVLEMRDTPRVDNTTFHYEGMDPISFDLSEEPLFAPRRTVLDSVLADAAMLFGVEARFGCRVVSVETGRRARVTFTSGDKPETVEVPLVIGADGVRSLVARQTGAKVTHASRESSGVALAYYKNLPVDGYQWYFAPGAAAGAIPTNDGLTCVFAGVASNRFPSTFRNRVEAGFHSTLEEAAPPLLQLVRSAKRATPYRSWPGTLGFTKKPFGPGWALVGDAGAFVDPQSAHGISAALRDSLLCAQATTRAFDDPSSAGDAWRLYEEERDSLTVPYIEAIDEVSGFRYDMSRVQEAHIVMSGINRRELETIGERGLVGSAV